MLSPHRIAGRKVDDELWPPVAPHGSSNHSCAGTETSGENYWLGREAVSWCQEGASRTYGRPRFVHGNSHSPTRPHDCSAALSAYAGQEPPNPRRIASHDTHPSRHLVRSWPRHPGQKNGGQAKNRRATPPRAFQRSGLNRHQVGLEPLLVHALNCPRIPDDGHNPTPGGFPDQR